MPTPPSSAAIPRPTSGDVVELILADHRLFEDLLRELRDATAERAAARDTLSALVVAHHVAEERDVYPRLERRAEDVGEHEVHHGEEEHAEINEALLALLEVSDTGSPAFDQAVEDLGAVLAHHLGEEEQSILNPAREEVDRQTRGQLGEAFLRVRVEQMDAGCGSLANVRSLVDAAHQQGLLEEDG